MINGDVPYFVDGEVRKSWDPISKIKEICTSSEYYAQKVHDNLSLNPKNYIYHEVERDCAGTDVWCFKVFSPQGFRKRLLWLNWYNVKDTNVLEVKEGDIFSDYKDLCSRLNIPYRIDKKHKTHQLEWLRNNIFNWEQRGRVFFVTEVYRDKIAECLENLG